jgi:glutathione S-transferase
VLSIAAGGDVDARDVLGRSMRLYYSPGSCALGVHVVLEEIGAPFELTRVNFAEREQYSPSFLAINPKAKVPALQRDDGSVLTEYQAISLFLALTHPDSLLIPTNVERQARTIEALEYVVGTIHATGFRRIFRPGNFSSRDEDADAVKAEGARIAAEGFAQIDKSLAGKDWLAGEYSIADPALFYVAWWAVARLNIALPAEVRRHFERMMGRRSVQKALKDEGF